METTARLCVVFCDCAVAELGINASDALTSTTAKQAPKMRCHKPCRQNMVPPDTPDHWSYRHKNMTN